MKKTYKTLVFTTAALACVATLQAQTLMLDFGPTASTGSETNSAYHTETPSFTDTTWNTLGVADSASLVFSDGTAATGISLNLGRNTSAAGTAIDLNSQPASISALGSATSSGIYAGNSTGKDAIFGAANSNPFLGVQVTGLTAGTYDIYIAARNTNVGTDSDTYSQITYAAATAAGDFDFGSFTTDTLTYSTPNPAADSIVAWVDGENYSKFTVSLSSGEALSLAVAGSGTSANANRAFLSNIQIVSVIPEPSAYALIAGSFGLLCVVARRRR